MAAVGYGAADIHALVAGAMKQQRLLASCPKPVTGEDLSRIFKRSLELW